MKAAGCTGLTPIMAGIIAITAMAGPMAAVIGTAAATAIMAGDIGAGIEAAAITTAIDGGMRPGSGRQKARLAQPVD